MTHAIRPLGSLSDRFEIFPEVRGRNDWKKFSFPVSYGLFSKVRWGGYEFDFNLRGHLKRISGKGSVWPDPQERMKRTDGNDFLYYGVEGYENTYDLIRDYYFPHNDIYRSALFEASRSEDSRIQNGLSVFDRFLESAGALVSSGIAGEPGRLIKRIVSLDRNALALEGARFHRAVGGPFPVLPPDTLQVDYEVIPLRVMDGCPHGCRFCRFKTASSFTLRNRQEILDQLRRLRLFYGEDLVNYNSLVLGENNALAAGIDLLEFAAEKAFEMFSFGESYYPGDPNLFLFGSADQLLKTPESAFERLNALPYHLYLNIGLESPDEDTLNAIGKTSTGPVVREAFRKALHLNRAYPRVHVTSNFILGNALSPRHMEELKTLFAGAGRRQEKAAVYLSPLLEASDRRQILREFREIKRASPLPVYLYLMQRL